MGMPDGNGMLAHPDRNNTVSNNNSTKVSILSPFSNFEVSPLDLYNTAQYQGFCNASPAAS